VLEMRRRCGTLRACDAFCKPGREAGFLFGQFRDNQEEPEMMHHHRTRTGILRAGPSHVPLPLDLILLDGCCRPGAGNEAVSRCNGCPGGERKPSPGWGGSRLLQCSIMLMYVPLRAVACSSVRLQMQAHVKRWPDFR
jgi:hypothetical protein